MTLDEAIKMYIDNAKYERNHGNLQGCLAFRQLAEWLSELKVYKERIPSYEADYNDAKKEIALSGEYERCYERGKADAQPKMGRWIRVDKDKLKCSECEVVHFIVQYPQSAKINYCPNCGQPKMQEVEE